MKKFLKALGRILIYLVYVFVILVIVGIVRWIFKALTQRND